MAVELPEPLQWVLLLLAGCRWPEADEDRLREMAGHCRRAAEGLKDAAQSADSAVRRALDGQQGAAAEALGAYWTGFSVGAGSVDDPGRLGGVVNALDGMGDMLEQVANAAETAKIQIVAQLGILAFEIATAEAEAPVTAGASMAQVPAFVAAGRTAVSTILKTLLKEMLAMAARQAAQMAAIDLLAQGIELAEGHRRNIDLKELGQNALAGAIGGASGHLIGKGLGGAAGRLGLKNVAQSLPGKAAIGAATGVGADAATQYLTTGKVDTSTLLGSGLSGGAGAGLHAGASSIKDHGAPPRPGGGPHPDLTGHQGGLPTFGKPGTSSGGSYHGPSGGPGSTSGPGSGGAQSHGLAPFGSGRTSDRVIPDEPHPQNAEPDNHRPEQHADAELANIEQYAELGASMPEKVALLNFSNSIQQAQNSTLTKIGETIASAGR